MNLPFYKLEIASSIKPLDFNCSAIWDEKNAGEFEVCHHSPCLFHQAVLPCTYIAIVPKHGRKTSVLQEARGCWTLDVWPSVTGCCKVGCCYCSITVLFSLLLPWINYDLWQSERKKFLLFCTLLWSILLYQFLLCYAGCTNVPIFALWLVSTCI